jgi:hypothetical protein
MTAFSDPEPDHDELSEFERWDRYGDYLAAMSPLDMRAFVSKIFSNAGKSAEEIAEAFGITDRTVRRHRHRKPFAVQRRTADSAT